MVLRTFLFRLLALTSLSFLSLSQAQLADWLGRITNTEEHLVHREQVGPYTVNADGQRLLENPYLKFDIRQGSEPVPADTEVRVETTLYHDGGQSRSSYTPEFDGRFFVIDPLELPGAETWAWDDSGWLELTITVDGSAGKGTGETGFQIFPAKPEAGRLFSLVNFGFPFAVLALFVVIYRMRRVRLQTYQA